MPPKKSAGSPKKDGASSHTSRAASLLAKARAQSTSASLATSASPSPTKVLSSAFPGPSEAAIPLPDLLKQLTSKGGLTMRDAMAVAGKLINARATTPSALSHISLIMLQDIGVTSEEHRKRTVLAFKGKKAAGIIPRASEVADGTSKPAGLAPDFNISRKRRRISDDDETLSREYGNVLIPTDAKAARLAAVETEYTFNEVLEEDGLRGRYAVVNRAPVMTAWAVILLERLAFTRAEALSLAHCYVNHTSTMRGISLGIIPASERDKAVNIVGPNQPHFELMGVKIPVMLMKDATYRGISGGEVVGPEKAFNYMRKSMAQTLPSVFGALTLLADSFMESLEPSVAKKEDPSTTPASGPEYLNSRGYELYAEFRPSTSGEWGKKGRLWYDKILALRRDHEQDLADWMRKENKLEAGGAAEEDWFEDVERLVQEELELEANAPPYTADAPNTIKQEGS